jgi:radical SAM superfamily enzyme YgiQ (UPF0313 family)
MGRPASTFFPEMIATEGLDALCIGEAEEAIVEFVERFSAGGSLPEDVRNFWVRNGAGEVIRNPVRPLNHELDRLPFPDRDLFLQAHTSQRGTGLAGNMGLYSCPSAGRCVFVVARPGHPHRPARRRS